MLWELDVFSLYALPSVCPSVRPSVHYGCRCGHNEFGGHVQNHHVLSAFTEMAIIFLEIEKLLQLQVGTLCIAGDAIVVLATGKNTRLFGMLDQNKTRFFTYVSQHAESKAATVTMID